MALNDVYNALNKSEGGIQLANREGAISVLDGMRKTIDAKAPHAPVSFGFSFIGRDAKAIGMTARTALEGLSSGDHDLTIDSTLENDGPRQIFSIEVVASDDGREVLEKLAHSVSENGNENVRTTLQLAFSEIPADLAPVLHEQFKGLPQELEAGIKIATATPNGQLVDVIQKGKSVGLFNPQP
ncbi:MAG: hypothetical protein H6868_05390 [Rhodospirillales bacterium]|nr:hypothetical protein [Rhodospirillales bacterium]